MNHYSAYISIVCLHNNIHGCGSVSLPMQWVSLCTAHIPSQQYLHTYTQNPLKYMYCSNSARIQSKCACERLNRFVDKQFHLFPISIENCHTIELIFKKVIFYEYSNNLNLGIQLNYIISLIIAIIAQGFYNKYVKQLFQLKQQEVSAFLQYHQCSYLIASKT